MNQADKLAQASNTARPPNPPWKPIPASNPAAGCLSFYISDDLSPLPVRAVTLTNNNKADPNLETLTYGVFSTCEKQMRSSVITRGLRYIVFVTRFGDKRVVTGYYRVKWFCYGSDPTSRYKDFVLAADHARFVEPISLTDLKPPLREAAAKRFRPYLLLDAELTRLAVEAIDAKPDLTSEYLSEIRRLEQWNRFNRGYAYWGTRQESFSWDNMDGLLHASPRGQVISLRNESPLQGWKCPQCGNVTPNTARLRACPECRAAVTLIPSALVPLGG